MNAWARVTVCKGTGIECLFFVVLSGVTPRNLRDNIPTRKYFVFE